MDKSTTQLPPPKAKGTLMKEEDVRTRESKSLQ